MPRSSAQSFERTSLVPEWRLFGLDSMQGYLELPEWYGKGHVRFSCDPSDRDDFQSMYFRLLQLEKDGLVLIQWDSNTFNGEQLLTLKQISLTTAGHKLLAELRAKSRAGKLKERLVTLAWAIVASILTTLVVLAIKGS
jgi:hypothetical protein